MPDSVVNEHDILLSFHAQNIYFILILGIFHHLFVAISEKLDVNHYMKDHPTYSRLLYYELC